MGEKKFKPTSQWMRQHYSDLNRELFNGMLGECTLRPFTKGKGSMGNTLGWFKITGGVKVETSTRRMFISTMFGRDYISKENFFNYCKPVIELNANYSWTESAMEATLVHEMCHYYTYMNGRAPKQGHGQEFYRIGNLVSSRSNGRFTIARLASAEQMDDMELDADIKAKNDARKENKKTNMSAVLVFNTTNTVELTTTTSKSLVDEIISKSSDKNRWHNETRGTVDKVMVSNDPNFIELLWDKGYKRSMRTYRYWEVTGKPWLNTLDQYDIRTVYSADGNIDTSNQDNAKKNIEVQKPKETTNQPKKMFVLRSSKDGKVIFKTEGDDIDNLTNALKDRFPKMSQENIDKLINNQNNYITESMNKINKIIKESINDYLLKEFKISNNDVIEINPDMNLGLESPFEAESELN